jgi:hypothetical protein
MRAKLHMPDGKVHTKHRHDLNKYQSIIFPHATTLFHALLVAIWLRDTFIADQTGTIEMDPYDFARNLEHFVEMLGHAFADSVLQVDVARAKVSKSPEFGAAMHARRRPAEPLTFSPVGARMIESVEAQVDSQMAKVMADRRIASMQVRADAARAKAAKDKLPAGSGTKAVPRPAQPKKPAASAAASKTSADKAGAPAP